MDKKLHVKRGARVRPAIYLILNIMLVFVFLGCTYNTENVIENKEGDEMIVDILRAHSADFTVDTAAKEVNLIGVNTRFTNGLGNAYFQPNDNLIVISIGAAIPHSFCSGTTPLIAEIRGLGNNGGFYFILGQITLTSENQDFQITQPVNHPTLVLPDTKYGLESDALIGHISMLNVPAVLHTDVIPVYTIIQVQHTLPMTN